MVALPERGPLHEGLAWLGWTLAGLGSLVGAFGGDSMAARVGWATAALGVLCVIGGIALRARAATPFQWRESLLATAGTLLLIGGMATLVFPCFVTQDQLRAVYASAPWVPLAAVAMALAGVVLLIVNLQRQGSSEPRFSEDEETKYAEWWPRIRLVLPPWGLYYLPIFLWESWREIDREAAREREVRSAAGQTGYDWRPIAVFSVGAVCLALMEYLGHQSLAPNGVISLRELFERMAPRDAIDPPETIWYVMRRSQFADLLGFVWWSGWRVLGFFLLPAVLVKLVLRERLADYGLATSGFLKHAWIYACFFAIVLVAVVVVSHEESFKTYYPFYEHASRSWFDFWAWELLYAAQFFSLEFFFRGFWLKAAKPSMGSHAIFAMVVPYCMIHFGKPFLETLGAIIAGVVLGTLALRTRSIWSGFLIHVTVAISMDMAALLQTTGLPDRWWPAL